MHEYFMTTARLGFGQWGPEDLAAARLLWGDPAVSRYICAAGVFTEGEIAARLALEVSNLARFGVQYWPVFYRATGKLAGCCGLRPRPDGGWELGIHLRPGFWGMGLGTEAASAVIRRAFDALDAPCLFAGHHPDNGRSAALLRKLGFRETGRELYPPTGLLHPSYRLER